MKLFFLIAVLFWGNQALAQNARPLRLADALSLARSHSAQLQKSELDRQSLEKKILEERSILFPQVSAGLDMDAFAVLPTELIPGEFVGQPGTYVPVQFGQPWHLGASIQVQQLIYSESHRRGPD